MLRHLMTVEVLFALICLVVIAVIVLNALLMKMAMIINHYDWLVSQLCYTLFHLTVCVAVHHFTHLSVCLSMHWFTHLSVCLVSLFPPSIWPDDNHVYLFSWTTIITYIIIFCLNHSQILMSAVKVTAVIEMSSVQI